eukprot:2516771-Pleurochrysis_carterae.AAC.1
MLAGSRVFLGAWRRSGGVDSGLWYGGGGGECRRWRRSGGDGFRIGRFVVITGCVERAQDFGDEEVEIRRIGGVRAR